MTDKTYHTDLDDAILDGWESPVLLPINGGEVHSHGRRCYIRNARRIAFLRYALGREMSAAKHLTDILGFAAGCEVHQFLRSLQFQLAIEKSPIRVQLVLKGRKGYWVAFDKRKPDEHD
jgi:hypothetical protein